MTRFARAMLVFAAVLACAWLPARAQQSYTFIYLMSVNGIEVGTVTDEVALGDGNYRIESHAVAEGLAAIVFGDKFTRVSEGVYEPGRGLRPHSYVQTYGEKERSARFDWEAETLFLDWGEGEKQEMIADDAVFHDRLSFLYQPFAKCAASAGLYRVTDGKRLSEYQYAVIEEEMAPTLFGDQRAVRLERTLSQRQSVLRLAPSHGLVPLSFSMSNGSNYKFILLEVQGAPEMRCG